MGEETIRNQLTPPGTTNKQFMEYLYFGESFYGHCLVTQEWMMFAYGDLWPNPRVLKLYLKGNVSGILIGGVSRSIAAIHSVS